MENNYKKLKETEVTYYADHILYYFNKHDKKITHLMLEKLLYFLEAIYMVFADENKLFNEEFYAWEFGPVVEKINKKYRKNGRRIIDAPEEIDANENLKIYMDLLYKLFGNFSAFNLVAFSHAKGSPWYDINKKQNGKITNHNIIIEKQKTKEWFKKIKDESQESIR